MATAPQSWRTMLGTIHITNLEQLALAFQYNEQALMQKDQSSLPAIEKKLRYIENLLTTKKYKSRTHEVESEPMEVATNSIGSHPSIKPLHSPRDDIRSKGKTPKEANGRACRHCGSWNHWDPDCPHSEYQKNKGKYKSRFKSSFKKGPRKDFKNKSRRFQKKQWKAKTNFIGIDSELYPAFYEYEQAYLSEAVEDSEYSESSESEESDSESEVDFPLDLH
jgi:hypothetical protein